MKQTIQSFEIICLVIGVASVITEVVSKPATVQSRQVNQQHREALEFSHSLNVAKSPLEPITLGPEVLSSANSDFSAATQIHKQSTRATQDDIERDSTSTTQQEDSSSGVAAIEFATTPISNSVSTKSDAKPDSSESSTTVDSNQTDGTTENVFTEETGGRTTTKPETEKEIPSTSSTVVPPAASESTTSIEPQTTTTSTTITTTTTTTTTSPVPEKITELITESAASTTESQPVSSSSVKSEEISSSADKEETSETPIGQSKPDATPSDNSTTTEAPIITSSTTIEPVVPSTTASAQPLNAGNFTKEDTSRTSNCNHLPTYDSEEIQKVFREETTFKNGTIKGKFTYINFDGRYRLVHYTRLPYGPVKIDFVEELHRPEESSIVNRSIPIETEIPNAVLQLRNILPNSLFGFPFLNPTSGSNTKPTERRDQIGQNGNRYLYSTDSISTPNLFSPTVPVSLPPGQQTKAIRTGNSAPVDPLSQSYYENLLANTDNLNRIAARSSVVDSILGNQPPINHIQYAPAQATKPLAYPINPHQLQTHYPYSPVPAIHYQPTSYYSMAPQIPIGRQLNFENEGHHNHHAHDHGYHSHHHTHEPSNMMHQTHQPHSHEHYIAPFMLVQSPAIQNDRPDSPRLHLKVKTSKSLDQSGVKSAQLRTVPSQPSPALVYRSHQRQRSGKQNQELRANVKSSPVVYHVLRSSVGRAYHMGQNQQVASHQGHAIAYDHDS